MIFFLSLISAPLKILDPSQVCRDRQSLRSREGFLSLKYKKSQFSLHRKPLLGLSSALMCVIHSNISLHTFSSLKLFIFPWIHLSGEENILQWQRKYTHFTCHSFPTSTPSRSPCSRSCFYYIWCPSCTV